MSVVYHEPPHAARAPSAPYSRAPKARGDRGCGTWYTNRISAGVGADVEALCSKCGDVWHVVVAKVGEAIVKVQCKQCGGYHRFKSPHGAPAEKKLPAANRPPKEPRPTRDPVERFEKPAVAADLAKPV